MTLLICFMSISNQLAQCSDLSSNPFETDFTIWWRHKMEAFFALLSPVTGEFPHKGQWRRALMFSLVSAWINSWVNNRDAGDLRRHGAHYRVAVVPWHGSIWHYHVSPFSMYDWARSQTSWQDVTNPRVFLFMAEQELERGCVSVSGPGKLLYYEIRYLA